MVIFNPISPKVFKAVVSVQANVVGVELPVRATKNVKAHKLVYLSPVIAAYCDVKRTCIRTFPLRSTVVKQYRLPRLHNDGEVQLRNESVCDLVHDSASVNSC